MFATEGYDRILGICFLQVTETELAELTREIRKINGVAPMIYTQSHAGIAAGRSRWEYQLFTLGQSQRSLMH